jgi:SNF2 family DNA or RNA helicase
VQNAQGFPFSLGFSLTFRLEFPKTPDANWNLGYYLQPLHNTEEFVSLNDVWSGIATQKEEFANVCDDENTLHEEVLRGLGLASKLFPPINKSLERKNPHFIRIKADEVMDFLRYSMHLLTQAGFTVVIPEQFRNKGQQRLTARMVIKNDPVTGKKTKKKKSMGGVQVDSLFGMDNLLDYQWEAVLEGKKLTENEFLELSNAKEPLIFWRGQWILIDQQDMDELTPIFDSSQSDSASDMKLHGKISYTEAIKLGMVGNFQFQENASQYEVVIEGDFRGVIEQINQIDKFQKISTPNSFNGKLREYQKSALTWLVNMTNFQFGVCLADDMGLGKTVEIIAFLLYIKEHKPQNFGSILIICPTSVLFNWERELKKFGPDLEILVNHGSKRVKKSDVLKKFTQPYRIILTTYGTIRNDIDFLDAIPFMGIIIDESQNIKNFKTQQTQAVLKLQSQFRICLSGTPIENRLSELWVLYHFLNPGLLGTQIEFMKKFVIPIERFHDEDKIQMLKKFISPFLMRRLKSDKSIIKDLPEKNEIKIYLELSTEQKQLYSLVVNRTLKELDVLNKNDMKRRGLVLKLLTQTKQICNHPLQYFHYNLSKKSKNIFSTESIDDKFQRDPIEIGILKNVKDISFEDVIQCSVKMQRILEMVESILESGQKLLIFTQFKQMGAILQNIFEMKYNFSVLFFHGGVPEKKRRGIVDEFQSHDLDSCPILILSLRAGGTGLNLTEASTVFHFDRWWNPAIEDQATDRAYRIGQKQQVNVYKYIAVGTIEEKIDQILEEKRDLTDKIISTTGEKWITDLSNDELKELFSLSSK